MDYLVEQIIEILKRENNLKARVIAKELGVERKVVNHYLYSNIGKKFVRNANYEWSLISSKNAHNTRAKESNQKDKKQNDHSDNIEISTRTKRLEENAAIEMNSNYDIPVEPYTLTLQDDLQKLVHYYMNCVLQEQNEGIELFTNGFKYCDLDRWPMNAEDYGALDMWKHFAALLHRAW